MLCYNFQKLINYALRALLLFLIYIYIFDYPLERIVDKREVNQYSLINWIEAYIFVIYSTFILYIFFYIGSKGRTNLIAINSSKSIEIKKPVSMILVFIIFIIFFLWSYIMQELKIGITIHSRTEALPFKLLGFLFYFRLLVQPFIISYIAIRANNAGKMKKTVIFMLIFSLGCWAREN